MAHYRGNESLPLMARFRQGLEGYRESRRKLLDTLSALNQMSDAQVMAEFSFSDGIAAPSTTFAGNAKGELASGLANLNPAPDASGGTAGGRALQQLLDQFA